MCNAQKAIWRASLQAGGPDQGTHAYFMSAM